MPLGFTAEMINALVADHKCIFFALRAEFASGILRLNTTPYELMVEGETYAANVGGLARISNVESDSTLQVRTVTMELRGVPNDLLALAANDKYKGRPAKLFFGMLEVVASQFSVVPSPVVVFSGPMDTMSSEQDDQTTIQLTIGNRLLNWERPKIRRYTHEDQMNEYPGDKGLEYVPTMVEKNIKWGME